MPSWKTPTTEEVERAITLLARPEQRRYFFDKLQNPNWLRPLEERGFFRTPPTAIRDDERGTVQFPPWPALQYLSRMGSVPEAQEDVCRIALNIPTTDNIIIHDTLAELATKLPSTMAAQFVPQAAHWLSSSCRSLLPTHLGALIKHLAVNDQPGPAAELAKVTLAITKKDKPDMGAHMEPWYYGQILKDALPSLTDKIGIAALTLTCDLLQTAAPPYTKHGEPTPQDGSTIWHDKIEEDEDLHGIKNLLVTATRNTAAQLAHQQPTTAGDVIATLEARPTIVFHRIALDILRRERDALPDLVTAHLANRDLFDDANLRHEYERLLHDAFPTLDTSVQDRILAWINDGPPPRHFENRLAATGQALTPEEAERYKRFWQRRHLAPIANDLPADWAQTYHALIAGIGPEPDELSHGFVGPTSPVTKDELAAMTPNALIEYLATWTPTDEFFGPSRGGIGLDLTSIVANNPTLLDNVLDRVRTLHPTYVRNYFYGLREANEKKHTISWEPVLDLATWVVEQPRDPPVPTQRQAFDDDQGWMGTRSAIADLLGQTLNNTMPAAYRQTVWRIITILAQDPEPTPAYEATYGPTMDAPLLAMNTVRGKTIEAAIKYALMLRQAQPTPKDFSLMPEVPTLLEEHLQNDPSIAIRAVYGRFFPWLVLLDEQWARTNVDRIFGDERGTTAWDAYVTFCPAYDDAVALLTTYYKRATNQVQKDHPPTSRGGKPDPDEHLGAHLMARYYRGQLPLAEGLVPRFFDRASPHARAHAIEYIGRILSGAKQPIPAAVRDRLVNLWAARRAAAATAPAEHRDELAAFGRWFTAGKLDPTWELSELRNLLQTNHTIALDYQVIERLARLASQHALLTIACLRAIVETERQYWTILGAEKHVTTILTAAIQDTPARQAAINLIHELGVIGYTKFRDLLPPV